MVWNIKYKKVRFVKTRLILSAVLFVLVVVLVISIFNIAFSSKNELKEITPQDYESLEIGQVVCGTLTGGIIGTYDDEETTDFIVLTENNKALVFRAPFSSSIHYKMTQLQQKKIDSVRFRGKVNSMKEKSLTYLNLNAITLGLTGDRLQGNSHDFSTGYMLDIAEYDNPRQEQIYVAYTVCALFFLVVIFFLLWKLINNAIYTIAVNKGKIEPEITVRTEDIRNGSQGMYETKTRDDGFFYVNTEYDTQQNEAAPPAPRPQQDIDYYDSSVNEDGNFYISGSDSLSSRSTRYDRKDDDGDNGSNNPRTFNY